MNGYAVVGLLGAGGFAVGLVVGLVRPRAPVLVWLLHRARRAVRRPSAAQVETLLRTISCTGVGYAAMPAPPGPWTLSDEQLGRMWRASSLALRRPGPAPQKVAIVEERRAYLEEFERRNPGGFRAWLASGSGPSDDLMPYLGRRGAAHAAIDWDRLTGG